MVGLGYWGPNLARNFAAIAGCELRVAVRRLRAGARKARRRFPGARTTGELEELLEDPELDAVVLATPVPTHAELAVRVARPASTASSRSRSRRRRRMPSAPWTPRSGRDAS